MAQPRGAISPVVRLPRSDSDRDEAWLSRCPCLVAGKWVRKLQDRARLAGQAPWQGRKVPEVDREDIREAIVGNYRIVYIVQTRVVMILTIFEGHRLLPDLDLP